MRKIIFALLTLAAIIPISTLGQDYYYSNGEKVPLITNDSQIVVITPKEVATSIPSVYGLTPKSTITDDVLNIVVCDIPKVFNAVRRAKLVAETNSDSVISVTSCYEDRFGTKLVQTGYIYVKLKSQSDYYKLTGETTKYDCEIVRRNSFMPLWYTLRLKSNSNRTPLEVANAIYESGKFDSAYPDFSFDPFEVSYDPDVYSQWALYNSEYEGIDISISQAWGYATGRGIKIAIVDQGIELTHEDLAPNIYFKSYDAYTGASPSGVYNTASIGHGTHCAGIAAAVRNNGKFIAGVAPDAKLISVSNNFNASNANEQLANSINWAWKNGADIISCSWRAPDSDIIRAALDSAIVKGREGKGCIIVKSSGNTGGGITFPGSYRKEIIAVGNLQKSGIINSLSCHGDNLLLCAPGTNILSTMLNNTTAYKTGTSMACPHVAGVAALVLERNPKLTANKVREILAKNTKKVGNMPYNTTKQYGTWNEYYGFGLINAYKAVINTPRD